MSAIDWNTLSPQQFEDFCVDLLQLLGFRNVRHIGGSGDKGRDVICERSIDYGDGFAEHFSWVVQCKHVRTLDKAVIRKDMAAAVEHRPNVWWLMTSAQMTPDFHDYIAEQNTSREFPFRTSYLDRPQLDKLISRFPQLALRYFPQSAKHNEHVAAAAMSLMGAKRYSDALQLLISENLDWSRAHYLKACCLSMLYAEKPNATKQLIADALSELTSAMKMNYLDFLQITTGWPKGKCRTSIYDDAELRPLRSAKYNEFCETIGYNYRVSGGCFPGDTRITLESGNAAISSVVPNAKVLARRAGAQSAFATVAEIHCHHTPLLYIINGNVAVTPSQPLHVDHAYRR